jgi:hypothetical protein
MSSSDFSSRQNEDEMVNYVLELTKNYGAEV